MNLATLLGIIIAFVGLLLGFIMEGGHIQSLIGPSAIIIIAGGTLGATAISYSLEDVLNLPKLFMTTLKTIPDRRAALVHEIASLADIARRDGLLALEDRQLDDPFMARAIMLVVDGTEPEMTREILLTEVDAMEARHKHGADILQTMGGFAPTMGIIGTVLGLIHVLGNLENPHELGPAIAAAFLATLYGVGSANLLWLPLAGKLKLLSKQEADERMLIIEGTLSIQAGDNPRIIREKLMALLPPKTRALEAQKEAKGAIQAGAAAAGGE